MKFAAFVLVSSVALGVFGASLGNTTSSSPIESGIECQTVKDAPAGFKWEYLNLINLLIKMSFEKIFLLSVVPQITEKFHKNYKLNQVNFAQFAVSLNKTIYLPI